MEACLEPAIAKCREFAKNKCLTAFKDARIAVKGLDLGGNRMEVSKLLSWVCLESKNNGIVEMMKVGTSWDEFKNQFDMTCCKGSDLLGFSNANDVDYYLRRHNKKK